MNSLFAHLNAITQVLRQYSVCLMLPESFAGSVLSGMEQARKSLLEQSFRRHGYVQHPANNTWSFEHRDNKVTKVVVTKAVVTNTSPLVLSQCAGHYETFWGTAQGLIHLSHTPDTTSFVIRACKIEDGRPIWHPIAVDISREATLGVKERLFVMLLLARAIAS